MMVVLDLPHQEVVVVLPLVAALPLVLPAAAALPQDLDLCGIIQPGLAKACVFLMVCSRNTCLTTLSIGCTQQYVNAAGKGTAGPLMIVYRGEVAVKCNQRWLFKGALPGTAKHVVAMWGNRPHLDHLEYRGEVEVK